MGQPHRGSLVPAVDGSAEQAGPGLSNNNRWKYIDDSTVDVVVDNTEPDYRHLQQQPDNLQSWTEANSITISYSKTVQLVLAKDGKKGLLGRGLKTRIMANGMQGLIFSVLWKYIQDVQQERNK